MRNATVTPDVFDNDPFIGALRRANAVDRHTACERAQLPTVADDLLAVLLSAGVVRVADGARYYLAARPAPGMDPPKTFTPVSVSLMMVVWVFVMLVPLLGWLIAR